MAIGFNANKASEKSNNKFDDELDDLDIDFDEFEDEEEEEQLHAPPKKENKKLRKGKKSSPKKPDKSGKKNPNKKKKLIVISLIISIIIAIIFVIIISNKSGDKPQIDSNLKTNTNHKEEPENKGKKLEETNYPTDVNPGVPDIQMGSNMTQNAKPVDPKDFIKDINGNNIPKNYEVLRIEHAIDFIDYTKQRGITGDGTELLWLDAKYKGRAYSVQVPFQVFKELDSSGITVVDIEILHLREGSKVVTYMNVRKDYKELLKKGLNNGQ